MSMNIGNLMRAVLGDGQPTDARAMELRIGQIVRGVLMEMLEDNEALIQINGVQVRAKLDTEVPLGRSTLLQVSQDSTAGAIVLKALADLTAAPADESLKDVARSFGLPDQKWSFELMRGLKRDGYPIGKDTANWFKQAAQAKPAGEDIQTWMNAAGVAYRRGLEPTETTIASLKTTLYGPPLSERMNELETLLADYLGKAYPEGGETAASPAQEAARKLQQLLVRGQQLLSEGARQLAEGTSARVADNEAEPVPSQASLPGSLAASEEDGPSVTKPNLASGRPAGSAGGEPDTGANAAGRVPREADMAKPEAARGVPDHRGDAARASAAKAGDGSAAADPNAARERLGGGPAGPSEPVADSRPGELAETKAGAPRAGSDGAWLGRFMELLGAGHERQAAQQLLSNDSIARQAAEGAGRASDDAAQTPMESLKSALLALASSEDAPATLREAAQGMAQQITGQQLLLSAERQNTAMMSHLTLFVPIKGQNGDTTATIHVQTRRGRKGELDSDNCRLLFQLNMSHIGDTLVDVQVIDRAVSLRVLNDRPWVGELIDSARAEAAKGLQEAGYQLLSLKTAAFPVLPSGEADSPDTGASSKREQSTAAYAAKPYKGVDYRA